MASWGSATTSCSQSPSWQEPRFRVEASVSDRQTPPPAWHQRSPVPSTLDIHHTEAPASSLGGAHRTGCHCFRSILSSASAQLENSSPLGTSSTTAASKSSASLARAARLRRRLEAATADDPVACNGPSARGFQQRAFSNMCRLLEKRNLSGRSFLSTPPAQHLSVISPSPPPLSPAEAPPARAHLCFYALLAIGSPNLLEYTAVLQARNGLQRVLDVDTVTVPCQASTPRACHTSGAHHATSVKRAAPNTLAPHASRRHPFPGPRQGCSLRGTYLTL